ncbi:MAG TPA: serine/threonine-protein kinase [Polyangiales bacterium]|nr:serine/threonine-protein kinase [Polyangiales bacterium]
MTAQLKSSEAHDARLPRAGDVVAGKYRVDAFIARGGMGAVLAATHRITGRRMALKWLLHDRGQDAEATHRFVREARAAALVRHPNVVDVYDVGEHDGSLFLVMELLEGETLHARLEAQGALDPHVTLAWLLPVMRGVDAAHRSGVIHRDLKPSNIFLCTEPSATELIPRVLDFGISKIARAVDGEQSLTRTGAVLGTPHYMAPEQLTGQDVDARTDVYALGVILYQCLTGQRPFHDRNYNALILQIAAASPTPIAKLAPHVPMALSAVVMRAMAREPSARFANVAALIDALVPFCTAGAAAGGRRSWTVAALLAVVVLGVVVAGWLGAQRWVPGAGSASRASHAPTTTVEAAPSAVTHGLPPTPAPVALPAQPVAPPATPPTDPSVPRSQARPRERAGLRDRPRGERAFEASRDSEPTDAKQPVPISTEQF